MRDDLPSGTVTFLFTDIAGSTRLLHELGAAQYAAALAEHRRISREAFARHGGVEVDTQGDAFFVAFPTAPAALTAVAEIQSALAGGPMRVRMGLHTGTPLLTDEGYVGTDVHRAARIAAAANGGQVLISASTRALLDGPGLRDLGEHRFKDLGTQERVFQLGEADFPPLRSLYRTNLPVPATPFLGREPELAEVVALVTRDDTRLITLTGPGGTGKTRLALQAAADAAELFPDGITWVPLAPLRDPALLLPSVAQALGMKEERGREPEETLAVALAGKHALLLLDNAEHLLPRFAREVAALREIDGPTLVVTSRERLRLQGEHVYAVPSLSDPDGTALFLARALALDPAFAGNGAVAELCARLDNLPLALELAAARTPLFSVEQLLERLGQRLDLLKGERDTDPRQRSLRATIEWSHELLSAPEQALFRRLSVFVGGCTYEAAEVVCSADADTLQSLIDKSLLRRRIDQTGAPRYWMLETIREYAVARLESEEAVELRRRHAEHYLALGEEANLHGAEQFAWLARLEVENANLRQALEVAHELPDSELELRLACVCLWFDLREARERVERALKRASGQPHALRAQVLEELASIAFGQGDSDGLVAFAEESLRLRRALGDPPGLLSSLRWRGLAAAEVGDSETARALAEERRGLAREVGDEWSFANASITLGAAALLDHEFEQALRFGEEACEGLRRMGDENTAHAAVLVVAAAELELGKLEAARRRLSEAIRGSIEGAKIRLLGVLVAVAEQMKEDELAAQLAGTVHAAEQTRGAAYTAHERGLRERALANLRGRLGPERLAALFSEGEAMSLDEAVERALARDAPGRSSLVASD